MLSRISIQQKRNLNQWGITLLVTFFIFYFSYHIMSGENGLRTMFDLNGQLHVSKQELESVQIERMQLEHKVNRMYKHSLDPDLLDEQARRVLGYAGKDETVIYLNK